MLQDGFADGRLRESNVLTTSSQDAGHQQQRTVLSKAAQCLNRNCGSAWTHQYVHLRPKTTPANTSQRDPNPKKNNINYHLSRMYPNIVGPHKRK